MGHFAYGVHVECCGDGDVGGGDVLLCAGELVECGVLVAVKEVHPVDEAGDLSGAEFRVQPGAVVGGFPDTSFWGPGDEGIHEVPVREEAFTVPHGCCVDEVVGGVVLVRGESVLEFEGLSGAEEQVCVELGDEVVDPPFFCVRVRCCLHCGSGKALGAGACSWCCFDVFGDNVPEFVDAGFGGEGRLSHAAKVACREVMSGFKNFRILRVFRLRRNRVLFLSSRQHGSHCGGDSDRFSAWGMQEGRN